MKIRTMLMLCVVICLLLVVCQNNNTTTISSNSQQPSSNVVENKTMSKDDVIKIFSSEKYKKNCVPTDCVVASDLAYGLTGIVQYTDQKRNPCCLAFVTDNASFSIKLGDNKFIIADDSILTYAGNGTVSLSLKELSSALIYDFKVEYSCNGSESTSKVSAVERKSK